MPTQQVDNVFVVGGLIWELSGNGTPGGVGTTQGNVDTSTNSTEQLLSEVFTIDDTPAGSPDGLWDQVVFTVTITHENPTLSPTDEDHGTIVFRLFNADGTPAMLGKVIVEVAPEDAPTGTTTVTQTITFVDIPPGDYRIFAGEIDTGDGEALRVEVIDGTSVEVVCFASDTRILTDRGEVPVQDLAIGDLVQTRDNGPQRIRWIGSRHLCRKTLEHNGKLRPVRIAAGALGDGVPETDLLVSQQHRIVARSQIAIRMFRVAEILCAAKHLVGCPGIDITEDGSEVSYTHFLLDRHQIVFSNGAETESMFTGPQALRSLTPEQREELLTLFPRVFDERASHPCCRVVANARQGRKLVERHLRNRKPLVDNTISVPVR